MTTTTTPAAPKLTRRKWCQFGGQVLSPGQWQRGGYFLNETTIGRLGLFALACECGKVVKVNLGFHQGFFTVPRHKVPALEAHNG